MYTNDAGATISPVEEYVSAFIELFLCRHTVQAFKLNNGIAADHHLPQKLSLLLLRVFHDNVQKGIVTPQGTDHGSIAI